MLAQMNTHTRVVCAYICVCASSKVHWRVHNRIFRYTHMSGFLLQTRIRYAESECAHRLLSVCVWRVCSIYLLLCIWHVVDKHYAPMHPSHPAYRHSKFSVPWKSRFRSHTDLCLCVCVLQHVYIIGKVPKCTTHSRSLYSRPRAEYSAMYYVV